MVDLLARKLQASRFLADEGSLCDAWQQLTEYDLQGMVRSLDKYNQGQVDWRALATILILLRSEVPTDKQLDLFRAEFKPGAEFVTLEDFVKVSCWLTELLG